MGKRRQAREMAIQMLYQKDLGGSPVRQILQSFERASYLAEGSLGLAEGVLPEGSLDLAEGSPDLAEGSPDLAEGSPDLAEGSPDLAEGCSLGASPQPAAEAGVAAAGVPQLLAGLTPEEEEQTLAHAAYLVQGTVDHLGEIDDLIQGQADNWRIERMPAVDRNILRLAIFEMLYERDVPKVVVLDEAIELAKKFGSEESSGFVNGLLDGLLKERQFPGTLT